MRRPIPLLLLPAALLPPAPLHAQSFSAHARAVPVWTRADPVPFDSTLAELRLVQPMLSGQVGTEDGQWTLLATVNFEGATLEDGELAPGDWGEGYMDRRHPHTWAHEVMGILSVPDAVAGRGWGWSLAGGRGFVPFGTDDPMNRPAVRYPVNHHFAQILERAVLAAGVRGGPAVLELSIFNGDEPEKPTQWPNWDRFGDSWAVRLTAAPVAGLEAQVSTARVVSPEHRPGAGTTQRKWSASVRWTGPVLGGAGYALAEWADTDEADGIFQYESALVEAEWRAGPHRPYVRVERTERPEEMRTTDPFRSVRPHLDNSILAVTRWSVITAGYGFTALARSGFVIEPLVEASWAGIEKVEAGLFDVEDWYGDDRIWSVSLGARVGWDSHGAGGRRMGRYGAVTQLPAAAAAHH